MIREMCGLFFIFLALLILLSLVTHDLNDPHFNYIVSDTAQVHNGAGLFGAYLSGFLAGFLGLSSYFVPIIFLGIGAAFVSSSFVIYWWRWLGFLIIFICFLTFSEAWKIGIGDIQGGGFLGAFIYAKLYDILSPTGSNLLWFFALLVALELAFSISWIALVKNLWQKFMGFVKAEIAKNPPQDVFKKVQEKRKTKALEQASKVSLSPVIDVGVADSKEKKQDSSSHNGNEEKKEHKSLALLDIIDPKHKIIPKNNSEKKVNSSEVKKNYNLPSVDLLQKARSSEPKPNKDDLEKKGKELLACLGDFNIQAELVRISPGPVVTMFELKPAPGVRITRISGLIDDICRSLKAISIRIQAPISGTDRVGVEIPNEVRAAVNFRELIQSSDFSGAIALLTIALGKDISGTPYYCDLSRMPHLLVAGATGAGKSVCLNAIIISFLYKAKPNEVKFLLVDPKRVEMANFADIPHLVHPVVTDMNLAKTALNWAVFEMDRRYSLLAEHGVKNITDFNRKAEESKDFALSKLPYLVIIIDELADLMLTVGKDAEALIIRLAQLARAAGIHLIIATQRPSVDVVTGLIKANFPCRISFQVTSRHDSRTILDAIGAEHLLGRGDMLFKPSGAKTMRLHGPFVSDEEVQKVVDFWKSQAKPNYEIDFKTWGSEQVPEMLSAKVSSELQDDPIYIEAVQFVREQGKVSISLIQRRFRIGFNRAAGFVEQMERDGILNPAENGKPRTVNR